MSEKCKTCPGKESNFCHNCTLLKYIIYQESKEKYEKVIF
jgi:hypothetical protein